MTLQLRSADDGLDCVVTIDHQGNILEFNPAAEAAFGYSRAEVLGMPIVDRLVPPALRAAHRRGFAHYVLKGRSRSSIGASK